MFNLNKKSQIFSKLLYEWTLPPAIYKSLLTLYSHQYLILCVFYFSYSGENAVVLTVILICIFLKPKKA